MTSSASSLLSPWVLPLIQKFYPADDALRRILLYHSRCVMTRAVEAAAAHPGLHLDRQLLADAAMLHDIGIIRCDAPSIECRGTEPYICHGSIGARMLREEAHSLLTDAALGMPDDLEPYARVCERHTGAGLTAEEIERQHLPLPHRDFLPETPEEQCVCWADKFYSKSNLQRVKIPEQVAKSLSKFGQDGVARFEAWQKRFG
jgi:uncharacterized protein